MLPSARTITGITMAGAALALGCAQTQPAAAKVMPYDGGSVTVTTININPNACPLQRIGHQLIRCDALTGNGVPAPNRIPVFQP